MRIKTILSHHGKSIIIFILYIIKIHLTIKALRHLTPTISGDWRYFPENYSIAIDDTVNTARYEEASKYILDYKPKPIDDDVELRIMASDRPMHYLTQVIGYFIHNYSNSTTIPKITICNAGTFLMEELKEFNNKFLIYNISYLSVDNKKDDYLYTFNKESSDYWKCINITTSARYMLVFEDDALVIPQFPKYLKSLVRQFDERTYIDYAKLYHPTALRKLPSLPIAIGISLFFSIFLYWYLLGGKYFILFVISFIFIYADIHSYGYQFIADVRYHITNQVYLSMPESCCMPAVLYRSSSVPSLSNELYTIPLVNGKAKDHLLDESSLYGLTSDTNLISHIGALSSIRHSLVRLSPSVSKHPVLTWSQYFW